MGIPILDEINNVQEDDSQQRYDIIVDAIFGFSFHGTAPREPFASAIANMVELQKKEQKLLVSVDVPSGWDVDGGDLTGTSFSPDVLISLTAPKLSAKKFKGRHFVGGRFLPPAIAEKYNIRVSAFLFYFSLCWVVGFSFMSNRFPILCVDASIRRSISSYGTLKSMYHSPLLCVNVSKWQKTPYTGISQVMELANGVEYDEEDWGAQYQAYLEEQELKSENESDEKGKTKKIESNEDDDWAVQYQAHVEEKEKEFFEPNKPKRIV